MSSQANTHHRSFLDATDAEMTADLGALTDTLSEAARHAERLGLQEVKEHLDAALAHVVEQHESETGA